MIEKGCDPSIKLAKFKFNCDECDKSIPNPLPQNLNHFMMIVGKPGSSKTTLMMNMICKRGKMYNKKFDRIYLFSPSLGTIEDCPFNRYTVESPRQLALRSSSSEFSVVVMSTPWRG